MRLVLAKRVCDYMEMGKTAQEAATEGVRLVDTRISGVYNEMGLLAVDIHGRIGAAHSSPNLSWAYMNKDLKHPVAALTAKIMK